MKRGPLWRDNRDSSSTALAADKPNFDLHTISFDDAGLALVIPLDALALTHVETSGR